jgi:hypothetical protein
MEVFAHRGLWSSVVNQNSKDAVRNAFESGYSVELDIWKTSPTSALMLGHDIGLASGLFEEVLEIKADYPDRYMAINIKCDGLAKSLKDMPLKELNCFCFDMSTPEFFTYKRFQIPLAARVSEFELPLLATEIFWLDSFGSDWWQSSNISFSQSILVSPELHKVDPTSTYKFIKANNIELFGLCVDDIEAFNNA